MRRYAPLAVALLLIAVAGLDTIRDRDQATVAEAAVTNDTPAHYWVREFRRRWRVERRVTRALAATVHRLRRVVHQDGHVVEAINLACAAYPDVPCSTLWRKADCETGGTFSATAKNPSSSASGLFQFLDSTWASTPYGRFSVWSPYANALAAGWMHHVGRGGEWACR